MQLDTFFLSAVLLAMSNVQALVLDTPTSVVTGKQLQIDFQPSPSDTFKSFSLELKNTRLGDEFAIANNVNLSPGTITVVVPCVPAASGYALAAVNITNINEIFAETAEFDVTQGPNC